MPKKCSTSNPKSTLAREKKKNINEEKEKEKCQQQEDNSWIEYDRKVIRRLQKRESDERKKQEHNNRKLEVKALLESELEELTKKSMNIGKVSVPKLTRSQICKNTGQFEPPKNITHSNKHLEENINRIKCDENVARSVEEAITVLQPIEKQKDKHPEKRMKAEYSSFQERRLKEIKAENSTLKLSQIKQLIFKEWKKSPENPLNSS